ncbi:MAG: glutaredoxin family protein [Zoogloeaceae bacterium]|jgi:glutaredoxin|nr:glutaredoxin family protein [Zoogloeaceae bacterium]
MNRHLHPLIRAAIFSILAFSCAIASAQTWRWTDPASGRVIYSDFPPAGKVKDLVRIDRGSAQVVSSEDTSLSFATRQAAQKYPVTFYSGPECQPCNDARQLLSKRGVPFTEKSVQTEVERNELKTLVGDDFVPTLRVGSQRVRGFDASAYNNLLDLAGYPKNEASTTAAQ